MFDLERFSVDVNRRLKELKKTQKDVAKECGMAQSAVSQYLSGKRCAIAVNIEKFQCIADCLNLDIKAYFGELENQCANDSDNVIDIEQVGVIKQFIDKELAIDINRDLVKIERLSPDQFRMVGSYIRGVAHSVEDMVGRKPKAG